MKLSKLNTLIRAAPAVMFNFKSCGPVEAKKNSLLKSLSEKYASNEETGLKLTEDGYMEWDK